MLLTLISSPKLRVFTIFCELSKLVVLLTFKPEFATTTNDCCTSWYVTDSPAVISDLSSNESIQSLYQLTRFVDGE